MRLNAPGKLLSAWFAMETAVEKLAAFGFPVIGLSHLSQQRVWLDNSRAFLFVVANKLDRPTSS
jgi:hypothetical protein